MSGDDLEACSPHRGYDYFAGSEISYITAVIALALVPFGMRTLTFINIATGIGSYIS